MARGGEHQALSLVVGASKTCSISRDAWGGQSENLVPSNLSRTHLCPDLTPACPNGKGIVATSGEAASGERLPRVGLQHSASSARNRGGKERLEAHQRKRNQFLPAPSIPPSPSIQQMCEKSNKRHGKGDLLLSISEGWIETIDRHARRDFCSTAPAKSWAGGISWRESRHAGLQFSILEAPSPTCLWMQPGKNTPTKSSKSRRRAFAFRQYSMFAKRWTLKARTIVAQRGLCHDFTTSPDRP